MKAKISRPLKELDPEEVMEFERDRDAFSFYKSLIKCRDLTELLEYAAEATGFPMLVLDSKGYLLAKSRCENIEDPSFSHILREGFAALNHVQASRQEGTAMQAASADIPVMIGPGQFRSRNRLFCKITIQNHFEGYLLVLEEKVPFNVFDMKCVASICNAVASFMEHSPYFEKGADMASVFYRQCFQRFLTEETADEQWISRWMQHTGLDEDCTYQLFVLASGGAAVFSCRRLSAAAGRGTEPNDAAVLAACGDELCIPGDPRGTGGVLPGSKSADSGKTPRIFPGCLFLY